MDFEITSHRPVIGKFIVAYKKLVRFLIAPYLKSVFEREDNIAGRMTDLDGLMDENLRTMSESLGAMVGESHKALMTHLQDFDKRFVALNSTMVGKFQWIDKHFQLTAKKMDEIFNHADTLFQTIDQKAETIAIKQAGFEGDLLELKGLADGLQDSICGFTETLEESRGEVLAIREEVESIAGKEAEFRRSAGELAQTIREMGLDMITQRRRLENILTELRKKAGLDKGSMEKISEVKERLDDHSYFLFENRFRGASEDIKNRQEVYLPLFLDLQKNGGNAGVLDVGCGRGEFLELLNENCVPAKGVDLNEEMAVVCKEKGLDVVHGDALAYLKAAKNNSIGGVIACQFIEHLPVKVLTEFVRLCHDKVRRGGRVVFETINPESVFAMKWFYMDMTHQKPIHPQAISFLLESTGFREMEIKYLSPVPNDLRLTSDSDENLKKIDNLLFGPQDYAIIARK